MKYLIGFLFAVCLLSAESQAQLFQRLGRAQVGSSCPGGVCPTNRTVASPVATSVAPSRGHWSYPGDIDSHLEGTHGVSTAGMSRQQKLDLHDSLHEGTAPAIRTAPVTARKGYQSVGYTTTTSYGSTGSKANYGSSGSKVNYGSSGSSVGYGSSGSSLKVGSRDYDGAVITSVGVPANAPTPEHETAIQRPAINQVVATVKKPQTFGL